MRRLSPTGASIQIAVRFTPEEVVRLQSHVERLNESAEKQGLPVNASVSGLVRLWVKQKLDTEAPAQEASHVQAALEKLRAAR